MTDIQIDTIIKRALPAIEHYYVKVIHLDIDKDSIKDLQLVIYRFVLN